MATADPTSASLIRVRVLLFARYAEMVGRSSVELDVPAPATVADVIRHLRERVPGAGALPERPLAALDRVHALPGEPVGTGAELALLPPMAGG